MQSDLHRAGHTKSGLVSFIVVIFVSLFLPCDFFQNHLVALGPGQSY